MPVQAKADQNQNADDAKNHSNENAETAGGALGPNGSRKTPFAQEIPDADAKMEGGSEDADDHECKKPRVGKVVCNVVIRGAAMGEPAFGIEMPADINEGDQTGVALERVKPVLHPGIGRDVGLTANPDVDAVKAVIEHRKKNEAPFDEGTERNGLEFAGDFVIFNGADERRTVGPEMLSEECANGDDAGQRMKLSEDKTCVRLGCRGRHALSAAKVPGKL